MKSYINIITFIFVTAVLVGCGGSSEPREIKSDVEVTKEFFSKLRSDALNFVDFKNDSENGSLEKEAKGFSQALEDVTLDTSSISDDLSKLFDMIKNMSDTNSSIDGDYNLTRVSNGNYTYKIKPNYSGTLLIPITDDNITEDVNLSINGSFKGNQNLNAKAVVKKQTDGFNMILNGLLSSSDTNITIDKLDINKSGEIVFLNMFTLNGESSGYKIGGNLSTSNYVTNSHVTGNGGKIPSKLLYTGDIENISSSAKIEGSISLELKDATNFDPEAEDQDPPKINISGKMMMPSHPAVNTNVVYDVVNNKPVLTFDYSYDDTTVTGSSSIVNGDGSVELHGNDGIDVIVKILNGNIVYGIDSKVTKNGKIVGTIEDRSGVPVIKYTDGTFESLQ